MKNVLKEFKKIPVFSNGTPLCLLLDFDGTISDIVRDPKDAVLSTEFRYLLKNLSQSRKIPIGIISGRAIEDIRKRVGISGFIYSGDHGFEIQGNGLSFKFPVSQSYRDSVEEIIRKMKNLVLAVPGTILQTKNYSTSLHYRKVNPLHYYSIKLQVQSIAAPYMESKIIKLFRGKKVFEIKPFAEWDKGKACEFIYKKLKGEKGFENIIPLYLGDDVTDEDAFTSVNQLGGISILVGKKSKTNAKYTLKNVAEVGLFLKSLIPEKEMIPFARFRVSERR